MVGIKGQTKDMIRRDIDIVLNQFNHATVNVYCENTTIIKPDGQLKEWFYDEYKWLDDVKHLEVLWNKTESEIKKARTEPVLAFSMSVIKLIW